MDIDIDFKIGWYWTVYKKDDGSNIVIYSYEKAQLTDWLFILKNKTFESNKHRFQFCETFDERLIRLVPDRSSNLVVAEVGGNGVIIFEKDKQLYLDSDNG